MHVFRGTSKSTVNMLSGDGRKTLWQLLLNDKQLNHHA